MTDTPTDDRDERALVAFLPREKYEVIETSEGWEVYDLHFTEAFT